MLCYHNRDMLSASIICAGWDKNKGGQVYCLPLGGMIYFFPSNAFLRRRRKKALLRVNDRGGGWRTCILALCRVCVCVRVCARMSCTSAVNLRRYGDTPQTITIYDLIEISLLCAAQPTVKFSRV